MITYSKLYSYVSLCYPNMGYISLIELAKQFYDNIQGPNSVPTLRNA